ncbi:hypothetical protein DKT77_02885 [Meridianimarinicoccus roseus]|uniref:SPOR domain-containing protein n=1 Tax=Meridianimarinicoccus roseus TaxID=2072018 RepID=A0A2V2LGB0_9RHOB|nr:SPOR domain-containing protein [Meridianimarinicoccus roseus]PWR04012.1 hypothetical protein DKT77_02885 [Meridianimarinicoccus roseus]
MSRWAAAALLAAAAGAAAASPAETPPADFTGDVYVDSAGCVFHRATLGARTVWAQRLDPAGTPVCGAEPSIERSAAEALPRIPPSRADAVPAFPMPGIYVQLGAFTANSTADRIAADLSGQGYSLLRQDFPRLFVLFAGPFEDEAAAAAARRDLRGQGFPDAFLRRTEP